MRTRAPIPWMVSILLAGGVAQAQSTPVEHAYDVVVTVANAPDRNARLAFALTNGDTLPNNRVTIEELTTDGQLGASVAASGKTAAAAGGSGFFLDEDAVHAVARWIQQDVSLEERLSFRLLVSKLYAGAGDGRFQPDQFSFAVLEAGSHAGYLTSDDPTTANALFTIDLRPGSTPTLYRPGPGRPADAWTVSVTPVPEAGAGAAGCAALAALALQRRIR